MCKYLRWVQLAEDDQSRGRLGVDYGGVDSQGRRDMVMVIVIGESGDEI